MLKSDLDEAEKKLYESNLAFENEKDKNENLLSIIEDLKAQLAKYTADLKAELEKTADLFKETLRYILMKTCRHFQVFRVTPVGGWTSVCHQMKQNVTFLDRKVAYNE